MSAKVACVFVAIVLALAAAFGASWWVFGPIPLLALAVIAVAIAVLV